MALVRVYCGISSASDAGRIGAVARLTVAVVDDSGRLLEACEINDDPAGYAALTAFLAERFGGTTAITVAVDDDEHLVVSLLAASGRFIAFTDDGTADDFADRFADDDSLEEVNAAAAERRAVGLARALQAGALSADATNPPREFAVLKPVLAAHSALAVGRHAAAVALREVLRELYPAALRAYPDPAAPVALAMLDALPEPSLLTAAAGRGRDAAVTVAARLVADGVCDNDTALEAVTALRVAITETPRRNGVGKQLTAAVAEAVRASVAAVRSADNATTVLIRALTDKIAPNSTTAPIATPRRRPSPTPITTVATPRPVSPAPIAPEPVSAVPVPVAVSAIPVSPGRPGWTHSTPPPVPPGFEPTPVTGSPMVPPIPMQPIPVQRPAPAMPTPVAATHVSPIPMAPPPVAPAPVAPAPVAASSSPTAADPLAPFVPTLTNAAINNERAARGFRPTPPAPAAPAPPAPSHATPVSASPAAAADPLPTRSDWPLNPAHEDDAPTVPKRVTPPWQADDLVLPSLRLVEPEPLSATSTAAPLHLVEDPLSGPSPLSQPDSYDTPYADERPAPTPMPRRTERMAPPPSNNDDTDLLIFASVSSAWFSDADNGESTWNSAMDTGWRAAEEAARPAVGADTRAGLPQRVPAANLVPGSPLTSERPLRIVRDAGEIAAHTSSYFRGWRRGTQEAGGSGGYSVGGRPGRESATGWDFSREHELRDERGEYHHRAANYR